MNFLAHLWLTDRAGLPLAGAVLGDVVRGRLDALPDLPAGLRESIRFHRQIDVATDSHPAIVAARAHFPNGARRWAGIILDIVHDHALALAWPAYSDEAFDTFVERAAVAVADDAAWQRAAARPAPDARRFAELLRSYRHAEGIDHALQRIAARLRRPELLTEHAAGWRQHAASVRDDSPQLLAALGEQRAPDGADHGPA